MDKDFRSLVAAFAVLAFVALSDPQGLAKEILLVHPPADWRLNFETEIANVRSFEYLPTDENAQQWTEMVTIQYIDNVKGLSPISLANDLRTRFVTGCARQTIRGPE